MSTALHEPPVTDAGGLDAALDGLAVVLDEAGVELWRVPDRDLAAGAVRCGRLVSRTTALLTRLLGEVDTRDLALRTGGCSTTAWTRHELNLIPREARTLFGVATAVRGGMAVTGAAFAAEDVSLGQAAAITATIGELPEDVPSEVRDRAESELVAYADRFDSAQLTRLGQHISPSSPPRSVKPATPQPWNGRSCKPGGGGSCSSPRTGTGPCSSGGG